MNNITLSTNSVRLIGQHGLSRFNTFQDLHPDRVDEMNPWSVDTFNTFTSRITKFPSNHCSIFYTNEGNIAIMIRHEDRTLVEVEFMRDKIEYFIENTGEEDYIGINNESIDELMYKLNLATDRIQE